MGFSMIFPQFSHGFPIYLATVKFDRTIHLHQTATADDGQSHVDTAGSGTPAMGKSLEHGGLQIENHQTGDFPAATKLLVFYAIFGGSPLLENMIHISNWR